MKIGPYEVLSELGRGGMGVVYRARGLDGQEVAVKSLTRRDPERLARFEREKRIIGSFTARDGFVPLLDAGESERGPYLVMPLVRGGTLRARLLEGALPIDTTVALGRSLAAALARAHERGIVHRDLKPENILFATDGAPLIADLGLAKHFDDSAAGASQSVELSARGALRGTAGYMAPEQMEDARVAGPPADVFALGAILYECLAGHAAFEGATIIDVISRVGRAEFEPVARARPGVPPWLAAVVTRMLAKEPADRPADASAVLRALEPRSRARPTALLIGATAAVGVLAAGAILGPRRPGPPAPRPAAPAPVAPSPPPPRTILDRRRESEKHRRAAEMLAEAGDLAGAVREFGEATELDPEDASAWSDLGAARARSKDLTGALTAFDQALRIDPSMIVTRRNRVELRRQRGDLDGAIEDAEDLLRLVGETAPAAAERKLLRELCVARSRGLLQSGCELTNRREFARAAIDLDRAILLDPWNADAWRNRCVTKHSLGDRRGAVVDGTMAIVLDPAVAVNWSTRAYPRRLVGDLDGSIADASTAIELDPKLGTAWVARADALTEKSVFAAAIADYDHAIELAPDDPFAWRNRGSAKRSKGDKAGALADYEHFLRRWPDGPQAATVRSIVERLRAGGD